MQLTVKAQWFKKKTENQKLILKKNTTIDVKSECALCFQALCKCIIV